MKPRRLALLPGIALALGCAHAPAPAPRATTLKPDTARAQLERAIDGYIADQDSARIAVSLIDLGTGYQLHINGDTVFHAASTMKVPVLLELFNQVEQKMLSLDSTVLVVNSFRSIADTSHYSLDPADDSDSTMYKFVGQRVGVRELARRMIVRSSNLATNVLIDLLTPQRVALAVRRVDGFGVRVLRGVEDGPAFQKGMNNTTTSRGLANVLAAIARCNHNTRASCDEMLRILSDQEFNEMIPAGLPAGTRVAHKTGWITRVQHDAAIVFPPDAAPYVLVVLTRGYGDTRKAARVVADISRMVWNAVTGDAWAMGGSSDPRASSLSQLHRRVRVNEIVTRVFRHNSYWSTVAPYLNGPVTQEEIGKSAEGRPIYLVKYGTGPTRVLLWSQMHGDESTATMALADLIRYLHDANDARTAQWRDRLTILMVPMLNPDGAETFSRQDALGIDINRDARALATPEARTLKAVRDRYQPQFGFNLHDQNSRTRVANTSTLAAIALLAPPPDASGRDTPGSVRAKQVAAVVRNTLEAFVPGHIAKYDDAFNPRAFGDLMQQWGTSTVLIESGGWRGDLDKQYLRQANFAAFVSALDAIASGSYAKADVADYESLLTNGSAASDLLIRGGTIVVPGFEPYRADIAVDFMEFRGQRSGARITEIGDLADAQARDTLDATGLFIHPAELRPSVDPGVKPRFAVGGPATFAITRERREDAPRVYAVENGVVKKLSEAEQQPVGEQDAAVGCYDVVIGQWQPATSTPASLPVPRQLRLGWVLGTDAFEKGQLLARPVNGEKGRFRAMFWRRENGSVRAVFTTGFYGYEMTLTGDGQDLRGTINTFSDAVTVNGPPAPSAPVTLHRTSCPN